jgi:hypothetical protein
MMEEISKMPISNSTFTRLIVRDFNHREIFKPCTETLLLNCHIIFYKHRIEM